MNIGYVVLSVVYIIMCFALVTVILLQKKRSAGNGGVIGTSGGSQAQTYWDKNKGRSVEGTLVKYTEIGGVLFFVLTVVLCIIGA